MSGIAGTMRAVLFGICSVALVFACTSNPSTAAPAPVLLDAGEREPARDAAAPESPRAESPKTEAPKKDEPGLDEIATVLSVDKSKCPDPATAPRCLIDLRYAGDTRAADLAFELLTKWQIIPGVDRAHTMDGGYRGMIKIEPAVPINADRQHLEWVVATFRDFAQFFDDLARFGGDAGASQGEKRDRLYRWRPLKLHFFRSIGVRTPTAYANGFDVAYNLVGSLNKSGDAVRETIFHELFHSNDFARPSSPNHGWSQIALRSSFDGAWKKCNTSIPCLTPYTPTETVVRGGTYYAFQPGQGDAAVEYAAELATRYYREHRAIFRSLPRPKPFKCGPPENARAWAAMRDEWFGGIDAVPACP